MLCLSVLNYILVGCSRQLVFRTIFKHSWPGSDADLFTSRTYYIASIKYMKISASESIRNAYFNLERLSHSLRLARSEISPLERLWNGFDSDAELFMYRT